MTRNLNKVMLLTLLGNSILIINLMSQDVHVWEKVELEFQSQNSYDNPYTEVEVWVDLKGPDFNKRCFGFWDGDNVYRVRLVATTPGVWSWISGSNQYDVGLKNQSGKFNAVAWTEKDKEVVSTRRGYIQPTENGHAFEYADGVPFIMMGDTWWSTPTFRFPWYDDDESRPIGPTAGFKDYVKFRKKQGFNCIAMLAAFPAWADDGAPWRIVLDEKANLGVRSAWVHQGDMRGGKRHDRMRAKDMHNEGGRAFLFPGKIPGYEQVYPDVDRINPEYFKYMDRKIDYLNDQGFIPFIEIMRRDASSAWKHFYDWPDSYARYIQYVWSRYQANNCLYSPMHYDHWHMAISESDINDVGNFVIEKYGAPPFGTLVSCNASPSSLINFGQFENNQWLTFHQTGNWREHEYYWYLTEIFNHEPVMPAINGEPYYSGLSDTRYGTDKSVPVGGTELDALYTRSAIYGSFLSGGFGGIIYGAQGLWGGDVESGSDPYMWDAFLWISATYVQHLKTFVLSEGKKYQNLIPNADLISPNKTHELRAFTGWAYCAYTEERDYFLVYFERDCISSVLRGTRINSLYKADWFNPRTGEWIPVGGTILQTDRWGRIKVPDFPTDDDWGLRLTFLSKLD